jgi:hypothetical protein
LGLFLLTLYRNKDIEESELLKMNLSKRIELLVGLGEYLKRNDEEMEAIRHRAWAENKWFLPAYSRLSGLNLANAMLQEDLLIKHAAKYRIPDAKNDKTVGLIMAGNIPYVGLQDLILVFLAGYNQRIKASSKDSVLINHLLDCLYQLDPAVRDSIRLEDMLKGCDAYIATGSDNSARYFEQYFAKYPHIIRKNRTSIAILDGTENEKELGELADDIQLYFGLGCRNVTQLFVPKGYDFVPLLNALRKYDHYREHDKYKNNLDYQLTIAIMNNRFYMTNDSIVLVENESPFSPISQLHYYFYESAETVLNGVDMEKIQCVVGHGQIPFGKSQHPGIMDYADGVDTMEFLMGLRNC